MSKLQLKKQVKINEILEEIIYLIEQILCVLKSSLLKSPN